MTIDPGLDGPVVKEIVDVDRLWLFNHPGHLDAPGPRFEGVGVVGRVGLVGTELVKIVEGGGLGEGSLGVRDSVFAGRGR